MAKTKKRSGGTDARRTPGPGAEGRSAAAGPDRAPVPRWLPPVVFVGLTLFLFRAFVFSDRMLWGNDTLGLGYVARAFYAHALSTLGTIPRWAPQILGGTPFLEALSGGDSLYPPSLLLLVLLEPYRALGWKLVVHYVAAALFMFGWVRSIGASRGAALVAGTAYMLAPYFVSLVQPGHDGKIFVTALAPLLFWAVERHYQRPHARTVAAVALVVGLIILTTHFQMAYFLFGAVGLYAAYRSVALWRGWDAEEGHEAPAGEDTPQARPAGRRRALTRFGLFLTAAILGAGVSAVQLVPAVDYVTEFSRRVQTTREAAGETGTAWSSSWSAHPEDLVSMVIPEFVGNNARGADWSQGTYWGRNTTKDNHPAPGLVILILAAVSFAGGARRRLRYFFAALGTLAVLFALGTHTPVWGLFYALVPGIRLFRAPEQILFLLSFSASTLGALGFDRLLSATRSGDGADGVLKVLGGVAIGLFVLAFLAGSGALLSFWTSKVYTGISPQQLQIARSLQPFIARGAGLAFLFGLLTAATAWASRRSYLAPAGVLAAVVLLVSVDEARVSSGFIRTLDFAEWSAPDGFVQTILQRETSDEPYRMLSFRQAGQDIMPALHGIELAAGHHPNDLARYRELIGMVGSGIPRNLLEDPDIRRLLNVRYVLWPNYQAGGQPFPSSGTVIAASRLQDGSPAETLVLEPDLPRARLVGAAVVRSDADAVAYMRSDDFDPASEVVLAEEPPIRLDGMPAEGTVRWVERNPNRLALSVTTARPALLVIADNWFPAWHATVDGADAPVLRAYHTLRAVPVPAGEHTVEMVYASRVVARSFGVSVILTIGLLLILVVGTVRDRGAGRPT